MGGFSATLRFPQKQSCNWSDVWNKSSGSWSVC